MLWLLLLASSCALIGGEAGLCSGPSRHCTCFGASFARCTGHGITDLSIFQKEHFGLKDLELLYIDNIAATTVPEHMFSLPELRRIQELKIINSKINTIQHGAFYDLKDLRLIDLQNNTITSLEPATFETNTNLEVLRLSRNKISTIDFVNKIVNLKVLQLEHNNIPSIKRTSFCSSPTFNSKIEKIILSHNNINETDNKAFECLKELVELDLSYNNLTFIRGVTFKDATKLQFFKASDNRIVHLRGLWLIPNVVHYDFENNKMESIVRSLFGRKGTRKSIVRNLNLGNNNIRSLHAGTFRHLKYLNFLILSNNKLTSIRNGTFAMNRQFMYLDVRGNGITDFSFMDTEQTVLVK